MNDGKKLEFFVSQIERILSPKGFNVEVRKREYDDHGDQLAEFDITLSGRIGSANICMLIECRDRPSEGPAPASWIEQLVGRRSRFKFNKVIAVSTGGFSTAAIKYAHDESVDLRTMENLSVESLLDWHFQMTPMIIKDARYSAVRFGLLAIGEEMEGEVVIDFQTASLINVTTSEKTTLNQVWNSLSQTETVWLGVKEHGPEVNKKIVAHEHISERFAIELPEGIRDIDHLEFDAVFKIFSPEMQFAGAGAYTGDPSGKQNEEIAKHVSWEIKGVPEIKEIWLFRHPRPFDLTKMRNMPFLEG